MKRSISRLLVAIVATIAITFSLSFTFSGGDNDQSGQTKTDASSQVGGFAQDPK